MTTRPLTHTNPVGAPAPPPSNRATGAAGLVTVAGLVAAVLLAPHQDVTTSAQLHAFLEDRGWLQALDWLLMLACGLAWLVFVVGLRRLLPDGHGRDLFTMAVVAGQAATWAGASLNTAAAAPESHNVSLAVYMAFGEAGHLALAAGTAATGLALVALSRAAAKARVLPTAMTRATAVVGLVLIVAAVIGPISIPTYALWLLAVSVLLLRSANTASPIKPTENNGG